MSLNFDDLNANYPEGRPCDDDWAFQCALRMSIALSRCGFDFSDYRSPKCSHGHPRGAECLANFLWRKLGRPKIYKSATTSTIKTRGIILFKDIYTFRNGVGDHIDLWNGANRMTRSGAYFGKCKQVWFFNL
jgi:hypothetical protein